MKDLRNISTLKNWDKNPREISNKSFARLLEQFKRIKEITGDWLYKPLLITKDNIVIGGNMRLRALRELGVEEVWVNEVSVNSQQDMFEIAMSDNDEVGRTDKDSLLSLIEEFPELKLDLYAVSFKEPELLTSFMSQFTEVKEDEAPPLLTEAESKLGEIYELGRHRLMCGDSTDAGSVALLMNGAKADMVFTDPPYGMNAVTGSGVLKEKYKDDIMNDGDNTVAISAFTLCQSLNIKNQVWWGANYYSSALPDSECWIVWDKNNGESDQTDCELAWTNYRSVVRKFTEASEKINRVHPTQKPISLISWTLKKFNSGDKVLDLFGGSGSTLIACEQTNRTCYMMELDPKYCDVIRKRYKNYIENNK